MSINLTKLTNDLNIIQSLDDTPTESASELKEKFDESGNTIKGFLNNTLIEEIKTAFNTIKSEAILAAHPIGSYYWSTSNTSPATLFGGTWTQVTDKFVLAAGSTYTAGSTGGEATHTLTASEIPAHTHGSKSITGGCWSRGGTATFLGFSGAMSGYGGKSNYLAAPQTTSDQNYYGFQFNATHEHSSVGGNGAHNNMPPYEVAYCWKRTA